MRRPVLNAAAAIAALAASFAVTVTDANAQFWSSAGGREVVGFPKSYGPGQIVVSFRDRRLYHVVSRGQAVSYPIAVPKPEARWSGVLRVSMKRVNPTWVPTARMRREKPWLPPVVQGGDPRNPLGSRALYLGSTLYRIHGTDAPQTIGHNVSSGCVRMHNAHVEELYNRVGTGTRVTANYKSYLGYSSTGAVASGGLWSSGGSSASAGDGGDWRHRTTHGG